MLGVAILIGFLILGFGLFVPFMIYRAVRGSRRARNFVPDLLRRTGLQLQGNRLTGEYKGYPTDVYFGLGTNYGKLILSGESGWGMVRELEGRNTFYQTLHVQMRVPGANFPKIMLKEHVGPLRTDQWLMDMFEQRNVELPEFEDLRVGRARVFGTDRTFAEKVVADGELQRLGRNWHFTDVRAAGDVIELVLNDNMVMPTFGSERMSEPGFVVQALDICARVAAQK